MGHSQKILSLGLSSMTKPSLLVMAGCNGAGKSSYSIDFSPSEITPYDYDKVYKEKYEALIPNELRDVMAHNLARAHFLSAIHSAIEQKKSFCYETNFNATPLYWPKLFKENGYALDIIYFCLDSLEEAKKRVLIRYENGGHFVPDKEVESRYNLGFQHLNEHWSYFDSITLFETSVYNSPPRHLLSLRQTVGENILVGEKALPKYLQDLLPSINEELK